MSGSPPIGPGAQRIHLHRASLDIRTEAAKQRIETAEKRRNSLGHVGHVPTTDSMKVTDILDGSDDELEGEEVDVLDSMQVTDILDPEESSPIMANAGSLKNKHLRSIKGGGSLNAKKGSAARETEI